MVSIYWKLGAVVLVMLITSAGVGAAEAGDAVGVAMVAGGSQASVLWLLIRGEIASVKARLDRIEQQYFPAAGASQK